MPLKMHAVRSTKILQTAINFGIRNRVVFFASQVGHLGSFTPAVQRTFPAPVVFGGSLSFSATPVVQRSISVLCFFGGSFSVALPWLSSELFRPLVFSGASPLCLSRVGLFGSFRLSVSFQRFQVRVEVQVQGFCFAGSRLPFRGSELQLRHDLSAVIGALAPEKGLRRLCFLLSSWAHARKARKWVWDLLLLSPFAVRSCLSLSSRQSAATRDLSSSSSVRDAVPAALNPTLSP
jgi:hypothetical protein